MDSRIIYEDKGHLYNLGAKTLEPLLRQVFTNL